MNRRFWGKNAGWKRRNCPGSGRRLRLLFRKTGGIFLFFPLMACPELSPSPSPARSELAARGERGRVFDIKRFSTHDGPGIRSTVSFTGCPLRCAWCHNPEAFLARESAGGAGARDYRVDELVRELERDIPYFDRSGGGVTLSGGEPLTQAPFVLRLLEVCRRRDLHCALDTCGLADPAELEAAARLANLVLYDVKLADPAGHKHWTGAGNRRILENLALLDKLNTPVQVRMPLIPAVNDSPQALDALAELLTPTRFRRISLLPYHKTAEGKYRRLGIPYRMAGVEPPTAGQVESACARLTAAGFAVSVGK